MATISVGDSKAGRRALVHDLPLVPFIDFMICLIAFLIVTGVWAQLSRIHASASGGEHAAPSEPGKELHVVASARGFELRWQQGRTVLETQHVPRAPVQVGEEQRYPALAAAIGKEWQAQGQHRAVGARQLDRAVLHVPNDLPFSEILAVLDAIHAPKRGSRSAFDVAFATE